MENLQKVFNADKARGNVSWLKREGMSIFWAQNAEPATCSWEGKCSDFDAKKEGIFSGKDSVWIVYPGLSYCAVEFGLKPIWGQLSTRRDRSKMNWGAAEAMVRLRERQPCRRGFGRGEPSRPPATDVHHHCCCCYGSRRTGATPILASQFLEAGGPIDGGPMLPAFGSVIFTLGSSRENAGINAHISFLFTKIPEENEEGTRSVSAEAPPESKREKSPMVPPSTAEGNSEMELQQPLLNCKSRSCHPPRRIQWQASLRGKAGAESLKKSLKIKSRKRYLENTVMPQVWYGFGVVLGFRSLLIICVCIFSDSVHVQVVCSLGSNSSKVGYMFFLIGCPCAGCLVIIWEQLFVICFGTVWRCCPCEGEF